MARSANTKGVDAAVMARLRAPFDDAPLSHLRPVPAPHRSRRPSPAPRQVPMPSRQLS
jgi:hypothetical protein